MSKLLCNVDADIFVPFFWQLSKYLEKKGHEFSFVSFSYRESLWLKKNKIDVKPTDIRNFKKYPIKPGVLSIQEIDAVLGFSISKFRGSRKDWENRIQRIATYLQHLIDQNNYSS